MKILVANSNTSPAATERLAAEARAAASPGTEIVAVTGRFGARMIGSRSDNAIAAHATIELMARHHPGCAAAVVAVSLDTGLGGAREMLPIPVVGMTEAALLTACMLGGRFGLVTFGKRNAPLYAELVESYGLGRRLAGIVAATGPAPPGQGADAPADDQFVEAARELVERHRAEVVIAAGASMTGMARRLQPAVPVPLLDGVACAVRQAELLARLDAPKPAAGTYAPPPPKEVVGVDPAIAGFFAPRS